MKITDDRKLGGISKEDVHSDTRGKMSALEDRDGKTGGKCMSATAVYFVINIQGGGGKKTGERKWKGKWSFINFYDTVISSSRELH